MRCLLHLLVAASPALAAVHELWWNLTYVENVNPDGLKPRRVIGVNGTWPPPPIDVSTNDSYILHAINSLDTVSSIHHHGMFFNASSWNDGAVGVTECGFGKNAGASYSIDIPGSGQWGTYWVHAHSSGQYVDGLRAPFVIRPNKEVHKYDEEFTVILGDWYHDDHSVLMKQFVSIANPGGAEPVPDSGLIYFAQNGAYLGPKSGTLPQSGTSVGFNENATLPFQPGKTYRLRIVNTSAFAMFFFWIDGHDMRVIEVDGTDIEEFPIDLVTLTVAQRYSILVTARNDTNANWAVHANMDTDMFDTVPDSLNPNSTASITYSNSASLTNLGTIAAYGDVNDISMVPVQVVPAPSKADKTIELEVLFDTMDDGTNHAMFNLVTYNPPLTPAILSALTLGQDATVEKAYGPLSFVLNHMDVVDLVVKNGDAGKHPFHIHGHKYQIVARSSDYASSDPSVITLANQTNPLRRDTIQITSGGSATLRFIADNPGVWLFHCHIEWHLEVGLAIQLVEAPIQAQQFASKVPSFIQDNCKALGLPISGNAAGHSGTEDLSGLHLGPFPQNNGWHSKGIGAMAGCVLTAVLGMLTVVWYALGGSITDEEAERDARAALAKKEQRGRFFGIFKPRST
ncbi:Fet3 protein [Mycena indigotica]|uniref:Fet3 protein n=1 Tax=Mycena indigotica TaxID=2126181 RepID=A0A8H6S379_9AGAR|nr:Fet3 protein [Mycena indigotica]KAF7291853.1 Fet3 protein [Mycena indigotica]